MTKKKIIHDSLRNLILEESGYQCACCGHRDGLNLTFHHIQRERDGGKTTFNKLIALCFNCHHRVDETKTISDKEIRRLKRHLAHQRLTQLGVNALKLAYKNQVGVIAHPFAVQHLVEANLLQHVEEQTTYITDDEAEVEVTALYRLTNEGREVVEQWLK